MDIFFTPDGTVRAFYTRGVTPHNIFRWRVKSVDEAASTLLRVRPNSVYPPLVCPTTEYAFIFFIPGRYTQQLGCQYVIATFRSY
ncbi:MAG: hypothetical protein D3906_02670 [Candidatus Electrothrix sp. AUS1_2]|nr:hypothetical protein [Candidatus Electrothrix sp. AUS1_2]